MNNSWKGSMTNKHLNSCLFLFLIIGLTSCVKDIILDAKEEPLLAVSCILSDEPIQKLKLAYTKGASQKEASKVTEATATLIDLTDGKEVGHFSKVDDKEWQLEYSAIPTHHYRLEVVVRGHESVWAEQTMPEAPAVESVIFDPLQSGYVPLPFFEGQSFRGLLYRAFFPYATIVHMEKYNEEKDEYEPVKKLCTDYPNVNSENYTGELRPWMEFEGYPGYHLQSSHWDWYLSQYPLHDSFLFLLASDSSSLNYFAIDCTSLYGRISSFSLDADPPQGIVYFTALSDDYYHYLTDAYQQYIGQVNDDLAVIYLRDNLFSNIHGGLGIFGAVSSFSCKWAPAVILIKSDEPDPDEESGDRPGTL